MIRAAGFTGTQVGLTPEQETALVSLISQLNPQEAHHGDCIGADYCSANGTCIPDGTCAIDDDCLPGMVCDASHTCVPDGTCGSTEVTIAPIAPNVLIVLDRSCSMRNAVNGVPKWTSAVMAINQLTTNFDDEVRWGLTMFPDTVGGDCGQGAIPIPVAP